MSLSHLVGTFLRFSIRLILMRGAGLALEDALRRADHVVTVVLFFSEIRFLRASCFCFLAWSWIDENELFVYVHLLVPLDE